MNSEELFTCIYSIANRSKGQALFLFHLCDKSLDRYIKLEKILKEFDIKGIPGDKESIALLFNSKKDNFIENFRFQSSIFYKKSIEIFILKRLKEIDKDFTALIKNAEDDKDLYSEIDYKILFNRFSAQKAVLYEVLSGHNNNYKF